MQTSSESALVPASGTSLRSPRWTARRWAWALVLSLGIQVALLFYLGQRPKRPPPPPGFGADISLAADPWSAEQLARLPTLSDPTLFALPSQHGFSGKAWLSFAPLAHEPAPWTEPPCWLGVSTQELGRVFSALLATNARAPLLVADKPMPRLVGADVPVPSLPLRSRSALRLTGDLAHRRLLAPLELPPWPHTDILSNSVVQALVDADGRVLTTTLRQGSGSAEADQHALRQATGARFEPSPRDASGAAQANLARGRLVFQWHTVPPAATNTPSMAP